jgi:hypothetical protein
MNEVEVERQIDQMVRFIKQEAEEKANEIAVSAEEVRPTCDRVCASRAPRPCPGGVDAYQQKGQTRGL